MKGSYWRINFSRVEWKVHVIGDAYVLGAKPGDCACTWPCYPVGCKKNPGDNWLWAPLGIVDVHQPERWGYIQFAVRGTSCRLTAGLASSPLASARPPARRRRRHLEIKTRPSAALRHGVKST